MKKCKEGHYYCFQDSKCKPIPKGFRRGVGGYLRREREDEKEDSKKNGNGNGKSNGSSNGNGNGGNGSGNGNGGNGGNGGGNGSGGVGESVEIQNSDGETTALVTDIIGPDHMRPRLNGKGVWTGTNISEKFGGYLGGIIINPSGSRNKYGLPDNMKPESGSGIKEVPLTPTHNRLLVKNTKDKKLKESTVPLPFFLRKISKTNALKNALPYLTTVTGGLGSVLQMARPRKDGSTNDRKNLRPDLEAELRKKQSEREQLIKDKNVNLDDKLNTPTDQGGFVGGKKIDKKTLERMNKPENQFNSYDPLTEKKKISGKALFPFKANVKIKNEIIKGDDLSIDNKNPVNKKLTDEYLPERKMTEKEKRKDDRLKKKYDKSDMKKSMQKQYGKEEGKKVYFATIRKQAMEEEKHKDHEPEMIRNQLKTAKRASKRIKKHTLKKDNFKAWVQSKITKATDYLDTAADYLDGKDDMKEELNKKDKPYIKKLVKNLRKGSKTHAKQADKLEKAMNEESNPRIPRKKGQPANSKKHSDLYTDENPKGTIHGLGFKDVATAKASVAKIRKSNRSHAHKIQAAVAMEQRAREMGKTSEAAVYRKFINSMKKKTKK